jgi:hypothetical protein
MIMDGMQIVLDDVVCRFASHHDNHDAYGLVVEHARSPGWASAGMIYQEFTTDSASLIYLFVCRAVER